MVVRVLAARGSAETPLFLSNLNPFCQNSSLALAYCCLSSYLLMSWPMPCCFCSTRVPLASTGWVRLSFSSLSVHFTLSSAVNKSQQHWKIPDKFFGECLESKPGTAGWEAKMQPLCYAASPNPCLAIFFRAPDLDGGHEWHGRLQALRQVRQGLQLEWEGEGFLRIKIVRSSLGENLLR